MRFRRTLPLLLIAMGLPMAAEYPGDTCKRNGCDHACTACESGHQPRYIGFSRTGTAMDSSFDCEWSGNIREGSGAWCAAHGLHSSLHRTSYVSGGGAGGAGGGANDGPGGNCTDIWGDDACWWYFAY